MSEAGSVLVTGASRGIGAAIAKQLLDRGRHVIGWARSFPQAMLAEPNFEARTIDLSDLDRLEAVLGEWDADVDAIVLNHGRGELGHLENFSYAQIRSLVELDFLSHAFIARAALPKMKRRGRGDLIFIGSEAGLRGKRQGSVYCAAKFAIRGFAQALRDECSTSGVRVSVVHPGVVKTGFFDELDIEPAEEPAAHLLPDDVANAVLAVLESRPDVVWDEVVLSPRKRIVQKKKRP